MRKRFLLGIPALLIIAYITAVLLAFRSPPLSPSLMTSNLLGDAYVIGIDLENRAPMPVVLSHAYVQGVPEAEITSVVSLVDPEMTAWCSAGTAALYPDDCNPSRTGPVAGWRVSPTRPRRDLNGLRIAMPPGVGPGSDTLIVSYRYLGWTFTLRTEVRWGGDS